MKNRNRLLAIVTLAVAAMPATGLAGGPFAQPFDRIVGFGDSLSDPGNAYALTGYDLLAPYLSLVPDGPYAIGDDHFSNGPTWLEQFADALRKTRSGEPAFIQGRPFANYAVGGGRAGPGGTSPGLTEQVAVFLSHNPGRNLRPSLFSIEFGGNDIRAALFAALAGGIADGLSVVQQAIVATGDNIRVLNAAGARNFLIVSPPNLAITPAVQSYGPAAVGAAAFFSAEYTAELNQLLDELELELDGVSFKRLDLAAELAAIMIDPAAFGLSNTVSPCLTLGAGADDAVCANPDEYLFWDGLHPTTAVHGILAEIAIGLVATDLPPGLAAGH